MEIPLLDLRRWYRGDRAKRRQLADELDAHLRRLGFLVVTGHGIDPAVISRCRDEARRFFHRSQEHKSGLAPNSTAYRGWMGPGTQANGATYGVATPPDAKETFAFGPVEVPDPSLARTEPRWYGPNRWPDDQPAFREAGEAWWLAARNLSNELLTLFEVALGLPAGHLVDRCRATTASCSLNWYWPHRHAAAPDGGYRIGPHTDFGTLTILDREPGVGGLQVLDDAGTWIDAPAVDGALIVNLGDMMRRWTNDRWQSNQHRVAPPPASHPDEELLSLIFFHEPDFDTLVEPFPSCVDAGEQPRYPPVRADRYLADKFAALAVDTGPDQ